jgi:hypothetical protein
VKRACLILSLLLAGCQDRAVPVATAGRPIQLTLPLSADPAASAAETDPTAATPDAPAPVAPVAPTPGVGTPTAPTGPSGGDPQPEGPGFGGLVRGLDPSGEQPVGGAIVTLSDGRTTRTDARGAFSFAGSAPGDGAYAVSHPAYLSSAVLGLSGAAVTLHLQPRLAVLPGSDAAPATWVVSGRVMGPGGPVAQASVVLRDPRGSLGEPAVSDDDGRFSMTLHAVDGRIAGGSLLVKGTDTAGGALLGARHGIALTPDDPELPPITVERADHPVRFALDTRFAPGPIRYTVTAHGPGGERLSLASDGAPIAIARLPGVRYSASAASRDDLAGTASEWHRDTLAPHFNAAETVVGGAMLEPPSFEGDPAALTPGAPLRWGRVAGASGYTLSVFGLDGQGPMWDGFAPEVAMAVPPFGHAGPGRYRVALTAWDQPGLSARRVAALSPSRLRVLPWPDGQDARRAMRLLTMASTP